MPTTGSTSAGNPKSVREALGLSMFIPAAAAIVLLSMLVAYSYYWNIKEVEKGWHQLALSEAKSNWNKDASFRKWATLHGGLYVVPNDRTPPNPYLDHVPNRDLTTAEGIKLTLMNPAYMMRQMTGEFEENYGIKGKITANTVLNPVNRPDSWQKKVLTLFENGKLDEFHEETLIQGKRYLRYMKPMYMTKGCIKCHGHLGFKKGDLRGGVSVSIPLAGYISTAEESIRSIRFTHLMVWFVGILAIAMGTLLVRRMLFEISDKVIALGRTNTYFRDILETAHDAIISIGEDGVISVFNQGAEKLFGYRAEEVIGKNISVLMTGSDAELHDEYLERYLTSLQPKVIGRIREITARHKNGNPIPVRVSVSDTNIPGAMRFTGIISDLSDIYKARNDLLDYKNQLEEIVKLRTAELESANKELKVLSEIDPLTKIANRRLYEDRLQMMATAAKRSNQPLSLLMIDIDYFKRYNDNYGHDAGDDTIRTVAETVSRLLPRATDLVARFGGEEFVVLLSDTTSDGAMLVAERIRQGIQNLDIEHKFSNTAEVVTVSIGIATRAPDKPNHDNLQKNADEALYEAKRAGRNCCRSFDG